MKGLTVPRMMTGAQAIIECLKIEGITKVFCVPGESYLPVLDALYQESTIDLISARHEGGASFMAEGYAKAKGKPGIVMATRGVGAGNLSIGSIQPIRIPLQWLYCLVRSIVNSVGVKGFRRLIWISFSVLLQNGQLRLKMPNVCRN